MKEASECTVSSLRPTLSTVSIMPGMENFAPERTESSSGSSESPSVRPMRSSTSRRRWVTSTRTSGGTRPSER